MVRLPTHVHHAIKATGEKIGPLLRTLAIEYSNRITPGNNAELAELKAKIREQQAELERLKALEQVQERSEEAISKKHKIEDEKSERERMKRWVKEQSQLAKAAQEVNTARMN